MAISLVFISFSQKIALTKQVKLKIDSDASIGSRETYTEYLGFPWPAVVATPVHKRLHKHCTASEVICSRKTTPMARIQLYPSHPTIPFKLCRRFPIKIAFGMKIKEAQRHDS